MVERFNGRIAEVLATHRFDRAKDLEATLTRYVWLYNHHLPRVLGHFVSKEMEDRSENLWKSLIVQIWFVEVSSDPHRS